MRFIPFRLFPPLIPFSLLCLTSFVLARAADGGVPEVEVASGGEARLEIVVGPDADETVRQGAADLARYLERIAGAKFRVAEGDGTRGLVVGVAEDFAKLPFDVEFTGGLFGRDEYLVRTTNDGLYLLGATPRAAVFAVWDVLHHFGHRQYFPSGKWEIVPERGELGISADRRERPDWVTRDAPRGGLRHRLSPWLEEDWAAWRTRNRISSGFKLSTGHAYDGIISRNKMAFAKHPEYLALRGGERGGTKFCVSNPGLRELVVKDAVAQVEEDPGRDSVSMDPSDGGGWCECGPCAKMGSVSDRVVILANATAEAINGLGHGEKYVGIYAYSHHSPPPAVRVHPKVVVSLATAFIKGGLSFEELLEGWSEKAELIGIREYYGLPVWDQSMPGSGRAGRPEELVRRIRGQHAKGARFINAESDNAWGSNGYGYYLASRLLWDMGEREEEVFSEFLKNCFGTAEVPMREFYEFIGSGPRHSEHMVGTMYRKLREARSLAAEDAAVRARLDDLVLYTRYVELFREMGEEKNQGSFDRVVNFLWRSRKTNMCDAVGMFWYLNRAARKEAGMTWVPGKPESRSLPPERLKERGEEAFSEAEITAFLKGGIAGNAVLGFAPLEFGDKLVPAKRALGLGEVKPLGEEFFGGAEGSVTTRGELRSFFMVDEAPMIIRLNVKTGVVYDVRGPAHFELARRGAIGVEAEGFSPVATAKVPEDGEWHEVALEAREPGLHRITWSESMSGTRVKWPEDLPRTVCSDEGSPKQVSGRHSWYFYVPKGTRVIGAYSEAGAGALHGPDGERVLDFAEVARDHISVSVPVGHDGKLWSVRRMGGRLRLLNVPPYAAASEEGLLLPEEVVEKDRR